MTHGIETAALSGIEVKLTVKCENAAGTDPCLNYTYDLHCQEEQLLS